MSAQTANAIEICKTAAELGASVVADVVAVVMVVAVVVGIDVDVLAATFMVSEPVVGALEVAIVELDDATAEVEAGSTVVADGVGVHIDEPLAVITVVIAGELAVTLTVVNVAGVVVAALQDRYVAQLSQFD